MILTGAGVKAIIAWRFAVSPTKTVPAKSTSGVKDLEKVKDKGEKKENEKLSKLAQSPAATGDTPQGRHWYLPKFLDIPHLYCDFLILESISHENLKENYNRIATLSPPYAEAMQECFSSFYGSVGIPDIDPKSIRDLLP